ncbi:hypothetical protein pipiens_006122 [Culex pipiens pipiens]|uniref:FAD dependent oxidoreductase domain-containing protein n=1 Tax=Culex pipiens pipiens TaxID=38569 RepID=A0ABD1DS11_CULPP
MRQDPTTTTADSAALGGERSVEENLHSKRKRPHTSSSIQPRCTFLTMHLCVVGAGVVGLTTGLELQRQFRNATVTILADRFEQDTCSDVAAGLFRPGTSFAGPTEEITR